MKQIVLSVLVGLLLIGCGEQPVQNDPRRISVGSTLPVEAHNDWTVTSEAYFEDKTSYAGYRVIYRFKPLKSRIKPRYWPSLQIREWLSLSALQIFQTSKTIMNRYRQWYFSRMDMMSHICGASALAERAPTSNITGEVIG